MSASQPRLLLHCEGGAVFAAALFAYHQLGRSWWTFLVLFLAPDLMMLGYLAGPRIGAAVYNLAHTYAIPLFLAVAADRLRSGPLAAVSVVWIAHIGFDRLLGFGLKYPTEFKATHFERL